MLRVDFFLIHRRYVLKSTTVVFVCASLNFCEAPLFVLRSTRGESALSRDCWLPRKYHNVPTWKKESYLRDPRQRLAQDGNFARANILVILLHIGKIILWNALGISEHAREKHLQNMKIWWNLATSLKSTSVYSFQKQDRGKPLDFFHSIRYGANCSGRSLQNAYW